MNAADITFVDIPAGQYWMGSTNGLPIEQPIINVVIPRSFSLSKFPVTQQQWINVMGYNPSEPQGELLPVVNVSWAEATEFCSRISSKDGKKYRLPTEREWEYACRAGTTSEYFFADESKSLHEYAWYDMNSKDELKAVALKRPNPWGLFDIVGNVWEWCLDDWHDYSELSSDLLESGDAYTSTSSLRKVIRGGSYDLDAYRCRSSYRSCEGTDMRLKYLGFRVVVSGF